jgi:hypothetical protein
LLNGICVPNILAAFSARINTAMGCNRFHSFGCELGFMDTLLICANGGGSNGSRNRSWKFFLQDLADEIGVAITVCHFPPGTSKWNKIEHCMFSFISMNWRGKPLASYETIIKLIGSTRTKKGLKVEARLDERDYEKGKKISDEDMARLKIINHKLCPNLNYSIEPRVTLPKSRNLE